MIVYGGQVQEETEVVVNALGLSIELGMGFKEVLWREPRFSFPRQTSSAFQQSRGT